MEILKLYFDEKWNLIFSIHWSICIISLAIILWVLYKNFSFLFKDNIEIDSAEIGIQGQKIKIKPNHINIDIAYKIWVELNTRKVGLQIDFENDVIVEIYKSWYQFFSITRELIKGLPANKIRSDKHTKELIQISTKILNEGLRPHLTLWQAKFHRWYNMASANPENQNKSPQELQKEYPEYQKLRDDMNRINLNLIKYKESVYKLAFGNDHH